MDTGTNVEGQTCTYVYGIHWAYTLHLNNSRCVSANHTIYVLQIHTYVHACIGRSAQMCVRMYVSVHVCMCVCQSWVCWFVEAHFALLGVRDGEL